MFKIELKLFFKTFFNAIIFIGFVYQMIDLTIDYSKYEIQTEIEVPIYYMIHTSYTICVNKSHEMSPQIIGNYTNLSNKTIDCKYYSNGYKLENCIDFDDRVYIRYKRNSVCLTYFNHLEVGKSL